MASFVGSKDLLAEIYVWGLPRIEPTRLQRTASAETSCAKASKPRSLTAPLAVRSFLACSTELVGFSDGDFTIERLREHA